MTKNITESLALINNNTNNRTINSYERLHKYKFKYYTKKTKSNSILSEPLKLRRTPTRLTDVVGKYSFLLKYSNYTISDRICILDFGEDLYETERGKRVLKREINKSLNLSNSLFVEIVF